MDDNSSNSKTCQSVSVSQPRTRRKTNYKKINNIKRLKLIEMVYKTKFIF